MTAGLTMTGSRPQKMIFGKGFDLRALRESMAVGVLVAFLLLTGGTLFALNQHRTWTAESSLVVLPAAQLSDADAAAYYETLSRGQIVATFAEVAGNLRFEQQAEDRLGLDTTQREAVSTEVSVVPNTAVILVRASAGDAAVAEKVADQVTVLAAEYWSGLSKPYRTQMVESATGSAYASSTSAPIMLVATLIVALVAGLAIQQGTYQLAIAVRRGLAASPGHRPVEEVSW